MFNLLQLSPISLAETSTPIHAWNLLEFLTRQFNLDTTKDIRYWIMVAALILVCMVGAYFLGSINPSIIISKKLYGDDIRNHGSGNAGTTNMMRTYGKKMAVLIFILDFSKAAIAVIIGSLIARVGVGGAVSALFVVLGHMFPVFYKFKGGKGVACTAACMLILSPISFLILVPIYLAIAGIFKYVSLASVMTALLFPIFAYVFQTVFNPGGVGLIPMVAVIIALLILFMHRENLKRIMEGKESKLQLGRKKKAAAEGEAPAEATATESTSDTTSGSETKKSKKAQSGSAEKTEKEYSDNDFIKCSCGRIIPKTREKCVYCGAKNPTYVPKEPQKEKKGVKKKKK